VTVQEAIEAILAAAAVQPIDGTVDTVKTGDAARPVTGVVTTFMATAAVIRRAAELGANLVITHEPTFYNHRDETEPLRDDPVYRAKQRLLDEHGIVVWRFHDYWHRTRPDGIRTGVLRQLGWTDGTELERRYIATIDPTPLGELARLVGERLGSARVLVAGPDDLLCRRVGMLLGSPPGHAHLGMLAREDVDAVVCGELNEWEAPEYVRDAGLLGRPKGLIVVGHAPSEEPGMAYLAEWLRSVLPDVAVTHVPAGDPFRRA